MGIEKNIQEISSSKTKEEVYLKVKKAIANSVIDAKEKKYTDILLNCLRKSKSLDKSLEYVWNYVLSSGSNGIPMKKDTVTKNNWFKGTAIHGMECHSK